MEKLNQALFLLLNAPSQPSALAVGAAKLLADDLIGLVPVLLALGWLRGGERSRKLMLVASASGLFGLLLNQAIGLVWQHPRPFMIGLGHTLIAHAADSSFPSDHLTLIWSVALSLGLHRSTRLAGGVLGILGLPVAWARIYLGVHFPLDMLGAALVAGLSVSLCVRAQGWYLPPAYKLAWSAYQWLFHPLIRRGWVRQ